MVPIDKPNNLPAAVEYWRAIGQAVDLPFYIYWMASTADKAVTPKQVQLREQQQKKEMMRWERNAACPHIVNDGIWLLPSSLSSHLVVEVY